MKKLHTPNHKLFEEYYLNQAKQKGGSLPVFQGRRYQRGYRLGSIFKGLFRWAVPRLKQGAKALGKKALKTGVNVVQDVLEGENVQAAVTKRGKQAIDDIVSHNTPRSQVGSGRKTTKRKKGPTTLSSASVKKRKTAPQKQKKQSELHHYFYK